MQAQKGEKMTMMASEMLGNRTLRRARCWALYDALCMPLTVPSTDLPLQETVRPSEQQRSKSQTLVSICR